MGGSSAGGNCGPKCEAAITFLLPPAPPGTLTPSHPLPDPALPPGYRNATRAGDGARLKLQQMRPRLFNALEIAGSLTMYFSSIIIRTRLVGGLVHSLFRRRWLLGRKKEMFSWCSIDIWLSFLSQVSTRFNRLMVKDFALISARAFPPPYVRDFGEAPFSIIVFDKVRLSLLGISQGELWTAAACKCHVYNFKDISESMELET